MPTTPAGLSLAHADPGLAEAHLALIDSLLAEWDGSFTMQLIEMPAECPALMSALYGPAAGDAPVSDAEGEYVDWDSTEGNEVRENAEADLTYTEAGWLTWEWRVAELHPGDPLYGDGVAAWVEENPDWMDDDDEEIERVLKEAGASESRITKALAAVRAQD